MGKAFGKVALLQGGDSPEREVSLSSAEEVGKALDAICEKVVRCDPASDDVTGLKGQGVERVFNILHGGAGENGVMQATLEMLGLPFTGSRHLACALAMDKNLSKTVWAHAGLPTPLWEVAKDAEADTVGEILVSLGSNLFVKPNSGGSSVATTRAKGRDELAAAIKAALEEDEAAIVEPLVRGMEVTYAILGDEVLPGIRVEVDDGFYDYEAKYESDKTRYVCPPGLPARLDERAREISMGAHRAIGCEGWSRVDLIVSGWEVFVLEVNAIPGMTSHSLVPKAAAQAGLGMEELVGRILEAAR